MRRLLLRILAAILAVVVLAAGCCLCYLLLATDFVDAVRYEYFRPLLRPSPVGFSPGPNNTVYIADSTTLCFWVFDPATDQVVDRIQAPKWLFDRVAGNAPGMTDYERRLDLKTASGKRYRIEVEKTGKPGAVFMRVNVYPPGADQPSGSVDFGLTPHPDYTVHDLVMTMAAPSKLYVLIRYGQIASFDEKGQLQSLPGRSELYFYIVDTTTDQVTHREPWSLDGLLLIWASPFGKVYAIGSESADVKIINSTTDEVKTVTLSPLTMPARPWASPTPR